MTEGVDRSVESLAYLGDAVIELWVRNRLVKKGISVSGKLNESAKQCVTAKNQALAVRKILPLLTENENEMFHRGRNSGHSAKPKSATATEYRMATGMETLMGYLYLRNEGERIELLLDRAYGI